MELNLTEEQSKELWDDEQFRALFCGCKQVVANLEFARGKHLVVQPAQIVFPDWTIEIQPNMALELTRIVSICPVTKEA